GSVYEVDKGIYTGNFLEDPFRNGKDKALLKFISENNLKIDLKKSIAIGDSWGDISMLNIVGFPIAFNPSNDLAKVAKKNNWKIIVERKDVIYEVRESKFIEV